MMNRKLLLLCLAAAPALLCPQAGFAQRQAAIGSGITPLDANGMTSGVDMSASGTTGTLTVGVVGGPAMDIFTLNNPPANGLLAVSTAASSQGNIVFNSGSTVFGGIGVTQPGGPFLLDISAGATGTAVNFQGPVYATILDVSGAGSVNFKSGSTNIMATIFAADGTITLAPNTILIGAMTTTAGAETGTLSLSRGSVLDGAAGGAIGLKAINVVGGSTGAGVAATITGAVDAYSFSLGTNTLNIGGALTIANGGTGGVINTTLASPTVYGNIRPVGATNLGPTLLVNVTVPPTAYIPVGSTFNIVQTQTGTVQSGTNGSVVQVTVKDAANPLYTFSAAPPAGTVAGLVAITAIRTPLLAPILPNAGPPLPPSQPIAAGVVPVLVAITPTTDLTTVLAAINNLDTAPAVVNAVAQLAPSNSALAAPLVTFLGARQSAGLWLSHLDDLTCGDDTEARRANPSDAARSPACPATTSRGGLWGKGFGYFGHQGAQGAFSGFDSTIAGGMIGFDAPVQALAFDGETRLGLSFAYERSTIDGQAFNDRTGVNTYRGTAYIAHESGAWFVDGDVSLGWSDYRGLRPIVFPGVDRTAQASYDGRDGTAYLTTGYHLHTGGLTITPLASLQYTHVKIGGYTEVGAGDIDLRVASQRYDFLESSLGLMASKAIRSGDGAYVPEVHVKWLNELLNPTARNTAAFTAPGSSSFVTQGLVTADNTFNPGVGVKFMSCRCTGRTWSLEAAYDYFWRNDKYSANQVTVKFAALF